MVRIESVEDEACIVTSLDYILNKESKPNFHWALTVGRTYVELTRTEDNLGRKVCSYERSNYIRNQTI